jgi:hypothetical protein
LFLLRLICVGLVANGFLLTHNDSSSSYAIIRHNVRTYRSDGVIAVIRGRQNAESELKKFEDAQDSSDRHEGWRYLIDKTDLKAGTDPAEATLHRQAELERRESKALRETETSNFSSPHRQR